MHRSLQALQFYTSHSEEQVDRLHERIRSSLATTESLTETMIQLTGFPPPVPFSHDHVTEKDWTAFLAGIHHDSLADFYGMLVARSILEETGPEELDIPVVPSPLPDRSLTQPDATRPGRKRRFVIAWKWIALLIGCFLLGAGGTSVYLYYISPATALKTTSGAPNTSGQNQIVDEAEQATYPFVYIKSRSSTVYRDRALTKPLYQADFGDGYLVLDAKDGLQRIAVTEKQDGYVSTSETVRRLNTDPIADEALLTWSKQQLDFSFVKTVTDLFGATEADLVRLYGTPARTVSDNVHRYLFYGSHFFTLRDGQVVAIDWLQTDVSNDALRKLAPLQLESPSTGLVTSNSYRLQRFETPSGRTQIRLAEQLF